MDESVEYRSFGARAPGSVVAAMTKRQSYLCEEVRAISDPLVRHLTCSRFPPELQRLFLGQVMGFPLEREQKRSVLHPAIPCIFALLLVALILVLFTVGSFRTPVPSQMMHSAAIATASDGHVLVPQATYSPEDLTIELDREGRMHYKGAVKALEEIRPHLSKATRQLSTDGIAVVQVEEGCPSEFVERVVRMYKELGVQDLKMMTLPPRRAVEVRLDATGKAIVDARQVKDVQAELRQIALKHGSRATVTIYPDPKCPSESVIQLVHFCKEVSFGRVVVNATEPVAEASH